MSNNHDIENIENALVAFISERGLRKTPERFAILHKALEMNSHFEVDALHAAIENDGYHVSRATVYNTVELLEEAGILRKLSFGHNSSVYEVNRDNHIHLICKKCGKISDVENPGIVANLMRLKPDAFTPESFDVKIYGICSECSDSNE